MMAYICKYGFFMQALLAPQAFAARMNSEELFEAPPLKTVLSGRSNAICGGTEIWEMMTQSTTVGSIQQIKWAEVVAKVDEFISEQDWAAQQLASELKQLQERIDAKRKQESRTVMTPDQVTKLIASGVSDFGGLQDAQRTMCGHPSIKPRAPRSAYRQAPKTFKTVASAAFDGTVRLDGDVFSEACATMLACSGSYCYCNELCQEFRDAAQDLSDSTAGALVGASSDDLLTQYSLKAKDMQFHMDEAEHCKQDKKHIIDFSQQIDTLKQDIKDKFSKVQDAEAALSDVMWDITDVEDSLKEEEDFLAEALTVLKQSSSAFQAAAKAFESLKEKEGTLVKEVKAGQDTLQAATSHLSQAKNANRVVTLLKGAVSTTMLQMALYFGVALQKPVESIGWNSYLSLDEYFHENPWQRRTGVAVKEAVSVLEGHCAGMALQAFNAVAETVDLRPLCDFGKADAIVSDINKAVAERTASLRKEIEIVVSWLDPYKGQNITAAQVQEHIAAGEPEGLREVISVYGGTKFFGYLQRWVAGGEFLQLINQLGKAITSMDAAVQETNRMLEGLQAGLTDTIEERKEATKQLEAATSKLSKDAKNAEQLQNVVKELQEKSTQMNSLYESLREEAEEARKKWEAAKTNLVKTHQQATSFLQAIEGESLEVLEQHGASVAEEISRLQQALREAQNSQLEAAMGLRRLANSAH